MSEFTRTLTFRSNKLEREAVLVLTFDDSKTPGIYHTVFPTAFKVSAFRTEGDQEFTVTYRSQLGFTRPQIDDDTVVLASTYIPINAGQKTILTYGGDPPIYSFSIPEDITPHTGQMVAQNNTDGKENIGVGFFEKPDRGPSQILVFEGVGTGFSVQSEFTPILGGYITSAYKENAVLRDQIPTPLLFKQNLAQLPQLTNWRVEYNAGSGVYAIKRE
ncbi:hypothetical protein M378DRAFT_13412 [Amanita muscaria Koide BX008]|uniref:Uncharacterized protein n=1 Tax=Amanita muscaria (strain Koide BX008) TaxID=946122 RepID=A0A0C2SEX7_AMAMK|nr:hypothetical protein M378DRAFT_13412 [Amanita muscaria Koide BX008]